MSSVKKQTPLQKSNTLKTIKRLLDRLSEETVKIENPVEIVDILIKTAMTCTPGSEWYCLSMNPEEEYMCWDNIQVHDRKEDNAMTPVYAVGKMMIDGDTSLNVKSLFDIADQTIRIMEIYRESFAKHLKEEP